MSWVAGLRGGRTRGTRETGNVSRPASRNRVTSGDPRNGKKSLRGALDGRTERVDFLSRRALTEQSGLLGIEGRPA